MSSPVQTPTRHKPGSSAVSMNYEGSVVAREDAGAKLKASQRHLNEALGTAEVSRIGARAMDPKLSETTNRLNESIKKLHI